MSFFRLFRLFFSAFSCAFMLIGCTGNSGKDNPVPRVDTAALPQAANDISLPGGFSEQRDLRFDSAFVSTFLSRYPAFRTFEPRIRQFYRGRNFAYAWFDGNGMIEQGSNLYNKIINIREEGLPVKLLYTAEFENAIQQSASTSENKPDTTAELMLTAQYFFYAQHVWTGLGIKGMQAVNWDLPHKKLSYEALLDSLLEVPSSRFMTTEPIYPQYAQLKEVLKKYRAIEESGGWPIIKAERSFYRKGDSGLALAVVRRRLFASGEFMGDTASFVFDDALESAVKDFQQRNGLKEDGVISAAVLKELNFPVAKRIEQLVVNMERCRWLPVAIRNNYIVINIPEYKFHAFEQDSLAWSMNVVVGTELNKTAIFNGLIQTVVFSPYWNVPTSIMQKETLPAIRRDKNYMARNHMEWNGNAIRQVPGPWNALGRVKFLFPNSHSIYLHDTQAKSLFGLDKRAFSHGCIRVAEPKRLAEYLLRFQPEWTSDKIDAAMKSGKEQFVKINKPVPVYIAYFTAWVDRKGRVNFRDDVYKRDSRLAKMLFENSAP